MPSLENKAVFCIPGDIREGRGGSDGNYFHYALLDWGDQQVTQCLFLFHVLHIHQHNQVFLGFFTRVDQLTWHHYLEDSMMPYDWQLLIWSIG